MLGRGLSSLIPPPQQPQDGEENFSSPKPAQANGHGVPTESRDERAEEQASSPRRGERSGLREGKFSSKEAVFHIEIHKIKPNPQQPRRDFDEELLKELAASIREFGIIQPLVVSKIEKDTETGTDVEYQLIAGERRLKACEILGWERVPAIIKSIASNAEQLELAVVENLQRENLNPVETARAYAKLQDEFRLTQREIASKIGKSRETISNTMRLLNLPTEIQDALIKNQINESQARLLLAIPDLGEQQIIFRDLLNNNLSVRELRLRVRKTKPEQIVKTEPTLPADPEISHLQEELSELLGAKVKIEKGEEGGKIIISFYSDEEIKGIVEKINPKPKNDDKSETSFSL